MAKYQKNDDSLRKITIVLIYTLVILILVFIISMMYDTWFNRQTDANNKVEDAVLLQATPTPNLQSPTPTASLEPTATPYVAPQIPNGNAVEYGFNAQKLDELDNYIKEQIEDGFPGAVLMIVKDGHIVFNKSYGYSKKYDGYTLLDEFTNMQTDTMFDLASLSKMYATTFSIMKLVDDGYITVDGKVSDYISGYDGTNRDKVTIQMLLSHNSGYITNYKFYRDDSDYNTYDREQVYEYIKQIPLDAEPGSKYDYNDINYMLLGMIVEEVSGMRIDDYARINIYAPLGIENEVMYSPLDNGKEKNKIAATERNGNTRDGAVYFHNIRQYTLQGEVHDENTFYSMDKVSGHAGLFATGYGLTVLNQVLLGNGEYGGVRIYSEQTINDWLRIINAEKYQLGFWNAKKASEKLRDYVSDSTFYHNGWTGTATIVDRENNLSIILLTNKRHSPCPNGDFEGTNYSIAYYVSVIQRVYKAMDK